MIIFLPNSLKISVYVNSEFKFVCVCFKNIINDKNKIFIFKYKHKI